MDHQRDQPQGHKRKHERAQSADSDHQGAHGSANAEGEAVGAVERVGGKVLGDFVGQRAGPDRDRRRNPRTTQAVEGRGHFLGRRRGSRLAGFGGGLRRFGVGGHDQKKRVQAPPF